MQDNYELYECAFPQWYKKFEKIAIRGRLLRIPCDVLNYLHDEIIILPKECDDGNRNTIMIKDQIDEDFTETWTTIKESDDGDSDELIQPTFPEFSRQIAETIGSLKGKSAFMKTNWHSPKDAYWITTGQTLKVKDITDVYQLLKASSIVKEDLFETNQKNDTCNDDDKNEEATGIASGTTTNEQYLIFKEWHDIHPGTEFRCFVRNRSLIAISPRDWPTYYAHIIEQKHEICNDIRTIFKEKIKEQFSLANFVFDVIRKVKDHIEIVDFSPFNEKFTESLAFNWPELKDIDFFTEDDDPEFRYLPTDCGMTPNKRNNYGIPKDIIDMFSTNDDSNMEYSVGKNLYELMSKNSQG